MQTKFNIGDHIISSTVPGKVWIVVDDQGCTAERCLHVISTDRQTDLIDYYYFDTDDCELTEFDPFKI